MRRQPDLSHHPGAALAPITARLGGWAAHLVGVVLAGVALALVGFAAWMLLETITMPFLGS